MGQQTDIIHHNNKQDYYSRIQDRKEGKIKRVAPSHVRRGGEEKVEKAEKPKEKEAQEKVEISDDAKKLAENLPKVAPPTPGIPSLPSLPAAPGLPALPAVSSPVGGAFANSIAGHMDASLEAIERLAKNHELTGKAAPEVILIKGFGWPGEGPENGLKHLSQSFQQSKTFSWSEEKNILQHIQQLPEDKRVVLVGYGLGGDTAIEVAKKIADVQYKNRGVELLVTMDPFGFNNQVIPNNVKKNINYFSGMKDWFTDGPKIAQGLEATEVKNLIVPTIEKLYDTPEVQKSLVTEIKKFFRF